MWMMLCGDGVFDVVCEVVLCGGMIDFMLFFMGFLIYYGQTNRHW